MLTAETWKTNRELILQGEHDDNFNGFEEIMSYLHNFRDSFRDSILQGDLDRLGISTQEELEQCYEEYLKLETDEDALGFVLRWS